MIANRDQYIVPLDQPEVQYLRSLPVCQVVIIGSFGPFGSSVRLQGNGRNQMDARKSLKVRFVSASLVVSLLAADGLGNNDASNLSRDRDKPIELASVAAKVILSHSPNEGWGRLYTRFFERFEVVM